MLLTYIDSGAAAAAAAVARAGCGRGKQRTRPISCFQSLSVYQVMSVNHVRSAAVGATTGLETKGGVPGAPTPASCPRRFVCAMISFSICSSPSRRVALHFVYACKCVCIVVHAYCRMRREVRKCGDLCVSIWVLGRVSPTRCCSVMSAYRWRWRCWVCVSRQMSKMG